MNELPTIASAIASMQSGELTPVDLVEHCLARIDQFEKKFRAWVLVDVEGARREAERLTELAKRGEFVGPLHGIPIGIKDIIDVAGMPTKAGSRMRKDLPPTETDAPIVAALRSAGAIILGKTVTTEWACFDPPPTRNPWNLDHTPGGSSSGSAAAVAMEMCMAALGTQTGGSIIRPAAYCGVCGLKPTYFPEIMGGIVPVSFHLDHVGPLARNASDLQATYLATPQGPSPETNDFAPVMCRLDEWFQEQADAEVSRVFDEAMAKLDSVRWYDAPPLPTTFAELHSHHRTIMAVDAAHVHREAFEDSPEEFSPQIRTLIETGRSTSLMDYVSALRHQHTFRREILWALRAAPLLVMPSTPTTAPGTETTGDAKFNSPWSYCGFPAITIPCGLDSQGLPVGMQIVGPYQTEGELLSAAAWCEARLGFQGGPSLVASA